MLVHLENITEFCLTCVIVFVKLEVTGLAVSALLQCCRIGCM